MATKPVTVAQAVAALNSVAQQPGGRSFEMVRADGAMVRVRFIGTGMAPFREATYSPRECLKWAAERRAKGARPW